MALLKNPLMSVEARGTTAGVTFTKTFAGWVAKAKPHPSMSIYGTRPRIRSILGYLARQWGELTDAQRESWRDWALNNPGTNKFGDPFIMSGENAYIMLNHTAVRVWGPGSENDLPPEDPPASAGNALVATQGTNPGEIDLDWTQLGAGIAADAWEIAIAGPFQSQGRVEVIGRFHRVEYTLGNILSYTLDGLDEGFWYWCRVRYIAADGQVTAWIYDQQTPQVTV